MQQAAILQQQQKQESPNFRTWKGRPEKHRENRKFR
jgi:hypothetical protein